MTQCEPQKSGGGRTYMRRRFSIAVGSAILLLCFAVGVGAQTEPLGGQPAPGSKPSVKDFEEQVTYQRAFEAVIWSQPAIGVYGIRRGLFALGMKDNEIMAMSRPLTTRHEFLTANNTTPYIVANADLRNGPVVLEIPPASMKVRRRDFFFFPRVTERLHHPDIQSSLRRIIGFSSHSAPSSCPE